MTNWTRRFVLLALGWLLLTVPARAAFHLMKVVEVFPGYASNPNAQYVELQMYFPNQNFVTGHNLFVYDAAGALIGTFTFPGAVANGADQASILIATTQAQTLFGVTADLTMTPQINASGGKACFDPAPFALECVAWGNYSGPPAGVGAPFSPGGLPLGQAAQRRLDRGTAGVLDPLDDTDDSATDFVSAPPTPRNNANVVGVAAQDFFTLTPCRVLDTRNAVGPLGGPALVALSDRIFVVAGTCGIPVDAKAISLNVAVTQPTNPANIRLHPGGTVVPLVSAINFQAGQTRSNNAVIPLSALGELAAYLDQVSGTAHLIVDVNGYFK